MTLGASIPHEIEALKNSAFLLTISWPNNSKLHGDEALEVMGPDIRRCLYPSKKF